VAVATNELKTAGVASRIVLSHDRPTLAPGWDAVALVRATIVDDQGVPVPRANDLITFQTTGPGTVAAVDNTENRAAVDPAATSGIVSFQSPQRHAAGGTVTAFVKATADTGRITVTASAPGLKSDSVTLRIHK
jgi:beta-galactosidase